MFNSFFRLSIHASAAKIQPDKVVRWCQDGDFLRPIISASRVQHISDIHSKFTMCGSIVDIQSPTAEIRRGKKKKELACGPMPNVMVALPNIGGDLCSTPQSLADAQY